MPVTDKLLRDALHAGSQGLSDVLQETLSLARSRNYTAEDQLVLVDLVLQREEEVWCLKK